MTNRDNIRKLLSKPGIWRGMDFKSGREISAKKIIKLLSDMYNGILMDGNVFWTSNVTSDLFDCC